MSYRECCVLLGCDCFVLCNCWWVIHGLNEQFHECRISTLQRSIIGTNRKGSQHAVCVKRWLPHQRFTWLKPHTVSENNLNSTLRECSERGTTGAIGNRRNHKLKLRAINIGNVVVRYCEFLFNRIVGEHINDIFLCPAQTVIRCGFARGNSDNGCVVHWKNCHDHGDIA